MNALLVQKNQNCGEIRINFHQIRCRTPSEI